MTKRKIEEVEEGNRELSSMYEQINLSIKNEEIKEREFDSKSIHLY